MGKREKAIKAINDNNFDRVQAQYVCETSPNFASENQVGSHLTIRARNGKITTIAIHPGREIHCVKTRKSMKEQMKACLFLTAFVGFVCLVTSILPQVMVAAGQ